MHTRSSVNERTFAFFSVYFKAETGVKSQFRETENVAMVTPGLLPRKLYSREM